MKSFCRHFFKRLAIFSGVFGIILLVCYFIVPDHFLSPAMPYLFLFFIALTILIFYYLTRASQEKFKKFLNAFLLVTGLKLLLFLVLIGAYVLLNPSDALQFAIVFFVHYLVFSAFEVVELVSYSKKLPQ